MAVSTMKRLSASIPDRLYGQLEKMAEYEGRSISNLVSFLLERSIAIKTLGYTREDIAKIQLRANAAEGEE